MTQCTNCGSSLESGARYCVRCGTQVVARELDGDPLLGRSLKDKYRVLERIGAGSMGTVYAAEHIGLKKRVAVKVLHRELGLGNETLQRFQREGIAAGKFNHPNAIQVFDFDSTEEGTIFLAMEFVEGEDLRALLEREGRLSPAAALQLARQALSALGAAHAHGIVHRDLKPENVMIAAGPGGEPMVKLLDFGLSKLVDVPLDVSTARTIPGRVLGTPLYMAPEQSVGREVDSRSDLYAVGLMLYELLVGERPFQGANFNELIIKQATQPAPSLADALAGDELPAGLDAIVQRALEKQPEDRFQSAGEMMAAIDALDPGRTVVLRARPAPVAARGPRRRRRGAWIALLLVLGLGAGLAWVLSTRSGAEPSVVRASQKPAGARSPAESHYVAILERARGSLRGGDTTAALSAANEAIGLEVHDSEAYLLRGDVYRARRDDDTALADYREALRLDPGYARAAASVGWIELDEQRLEAARARFAESLALDAECALAIAGEAAVLAADGEGERAFERLERAVAIDSACAPAQEHLGRLLLARGEASRAIEALIAGKRADPSSVPILCALAEAYFANAQSDRAEVQLQAALELDPLDVDALGALASSYVERGHHTDALELLDEPLRRRIDAPELIVLAGLAHDGRGERGRAIERLEEAVAAGVRSAELAGLLGSLYLREGASEPALEQFQIAVELAEDEPRAWLDLGLALLTLERAAEARDAVARAIELDAELAPAQLVMGVLYMDHLGDPALAMTHLARYRELGGEDARAEQWLRELGG